MSLRPDSMTRHSPSSPLWPRKNDEDIGIRFGRPSALRVLIRATGVPKYKMAGVITVEGKVVCDATVTCALTDRVKKAASAETAE